MLRFGLTEIEQVGPEAGEDIALAAEAARLHSADDLRIAAGAALPTSPGPMTNPAARSARSPPPARPWSRGRATRRWPIWAGGWPRPAISWLIWPVSWPAI